jgi:hypothetical protein
MTRIAELADLLDASGHRHVHSKVMILAVTAAVVLIVGVVLVLLSGHLAWPDVAALGLLLLTPYGLDGFKTLVKLRFGIPSATCALAPQGIAARRATGAEEGVEPAP